jgi:RNA polymerase sigma factor (sigma-70 family)
VSAVPRAARADCDDLYRRYAAGIYRYVRAAVGNRADAEDVTQQTFLNAYRAISQGTSPIKAQNWLLAIAHNEIRRHFRRTRGQPLEVQLDEETASAPTEPDHPTLADVVCALQQLPPLQRSALVMRELEGRSYAEIAEILEVTESALETLIFRARRALAEELKSELTCVDVRQALSRPRRRLPLRKSRRLGAHLRECPSCLRLARAGKRNGSLLGALSSLLLLPAQQAGAAGLASTFALKAAAVTAAVGVAGGVGYTVTARDEVVKAAPKATRAAAAAADRPNHGLVVTDVRKRRGATRRRARASIARVDQKPKRARASRIRLPRVAQSAKASKINRPRRLPRPQLPNAANVRHGERTKVKSKNIRPRIVGQKAAPSLRFRRNQKEAARSVEKAKSVPVPAPAEKRVEPPRHGRKD